MQLVCQQTPRKKRKKEKKLLIVGALSPSGGNRKLRSPGQPCACLVTGRGKRADSWACASFLFDEGDVALGV